MPFGFKLSQRLARMHDRGLNSSAARRLLPVAHPRLSVAKVVLSADAITLAPHTTTMHRAVSLPGERPVRSTNKEGSS